MLESEAHLDSSCLVALDGEQYFVLLRLRFEHDSEPLVCGLVRRLQSKVRELQVKLNSYCLCLARVLEVKDCTLV